MKSGSLNLLGPSGPFQALPFSNAIADFLFSKMCEPFLGPIQPRIQWIPWEPSSGVKRLGPGADRKPQNSAQIKNAWSYICTTLPAPLWHAKGQLYIYLY